MVKPFGMTCPACGSVMLVYGFVVPTGCVDTEHFPCPDCGALLFRHTEVTMRETNPDDLPNGDEDQDDLGEGEEPAQGNATTRWLCGSCGVLS